MHRPGISENSIKGAGGWQASRITLYCKYELNGLPALVGFAVARGVVSVPELQEMYCKRGKVGQGSKRQPKGPAAAAPVRC